MVYGWAGTTLRVDLTGERITKEPLSMKIAKSFIGGAGMAAKMLYDEVDPEVDPYDPANELIFATGPLTGTLSPSNSRFCVTTKNPHTGGFGDSNCGGHWGPELKYAGYDVLVIAGRGKKPVYIWIDDDQVELRNADSLWGKTTWETETLIKEEVGDQDIQVAAIGPAGERLVRCACFIINLARAAGWGGNGAVAGSKNLKAIAVRGTKDIKIAKPEKFMRACEEYHEKILKSPSLRELAYTGNPFLTEFNQEAATGTNSCYNFQVAKVPKPYLDQVTIECLWKTLWLKNIACFSCPVSCSHLMAVREAPYMGTMGEGVEWMPIMEAMKMGIFNLSFVAKYVNMASQLGLDTDGPGCAIAWAMECYERGIITRKDTDGIDLTWGNEKAVLELLHKIARKEGFGSLLAEGVYRASMELGRGSERYAHYGRGGCEARMDMRFSYGHALAQAISTRGPDHLKGAGALEQGAYTPERVRELGFLPEKAMNPTIPDEKAKVVIWNEHLSILCDSMPICKSVSHFYTGEMREKDFARLISLATGWDVTAEELVRCAERINNIEKAYNVRSGVGSRDDDKLPRRMHEKPLKTALSVIDRGVFERLKDEYYHFRGWDVETGFPTNRKLKELGLKYVVDDLERCGIKLL